MTRRVSILAMVVVIVAVAAPGCAPRAARRNAKEAAWKLMEPPQTPDERYPRGYRVQYDAPVPTWTTTGEFPTVADCEQAKRARVNDTIERAKAASSPDEAKFDLDVRRAVHAQCVQPQSLKDVAPASGR